METMRAARLLELGKLVCESAPVRAPEEGELLVRSRYASICGSDLHAVYMGVTVPSFPQPPGYPGHEGVGSVVESRHPDFQAGDLVLTVPQPPASYCFADYQTIPGQACVRLPQGQSPPQHLLMAQQLGTVIHAFRQMAVDVTGRTAVVMGQGSAGMFFSFLLKRAGAARVIVTDLSEARLAQSHRFGADVAVQAGRQDVRDAVMDLTGGEGAAFLVEAVGSRETLLQTVDLVGMGAEMLWFGLPDSTEPVPVNFHDFFRKKLRAKCTYAAQREPNLVSFKAAVDLIVRGEIDVSPLLSHMLPIEQIGEAMRLAHHRDDNALKVSVDLA